MKKIHVIIKLILPILAIIFSVMTYYGLKDSGKQKATPYPYYIYFVMLILGLYVIVVLAAVLIKKWIKILIYKAPLIAGVLLLFMIINIVTSKTTILPTLYFPSLDRIIGLLFEQRIFLLENVLSLLKLLIIGFIWGASIGFLTGLALSVFPTTHVANVFLIAFAVWFPVTLMTSSGIQSTSQVHFEVSSTLGASTLYKIVHVAIPSAMPSIFLGIFYGTVSSFATLMAVEMNGNSSGIGWYINWQKQVMMYDGVYAGLIIIAVICSLILTLLFKVRDRILVWQKGVIKW